MAVKQKADWFLSEVTHRHTSSTHFCFSTSFFLPGVNFGLPLRHFLNFTHGHKTKSNFIKPHFFSHLLVLLSLHFIYYVYIGLPQGHYHNVHPLSDVCEIWTFYTQSDSSSVHGSAHYCGWQNLSIFHLSFPYVIWIIMYFKNYSQMDVMFLFLLL